MNVYEKLMTVQSNMKAPKGQYNSFGKYKYRSCEDILEAVKPHLKEVKAVIVVGDELLMIGERYYVKATARFIDTENGEEIGNTAYAREELEKKGMDGSQITGTASSYARKYCLNGLLAIDDTKDADTDAYHNQTNNQKDVPKSKNDSVFKDGYSVSKVQINDTAQGRVVLVQSSNGSFYDLKKLPIDTLMTLVGKRGYEDAQDYINKEIDTRSA